MESGRRQGDRWIVKLILMMAWLSASSTALGQTTEFTYQGRLTDSGNPADSIYDFEFRLFDQPEDGSQIGSTLQLLSVAVTNGVFTVQLDFGNRFTGDKRFLEISVRPAGGAVFTLLTPRQQVMSNPYAIKSLSAATADGLSVACVNCVTSSQIQSVAGSAVTGAIPVASVPAGSGNYIQNATAQQAGSNFNISGNGTAGAFNAQTQYNIGGSRVLSIAGTTSLFVGVNAGTNTTGAGNSFFGRSAGVANTTGALNAYFGYLAGQNSTASGNSFFGGQSGMANTTGSGNAFFGTDAGFDNTTGSENAFFGNSAGANNTASQNSFFGASAGVANSSGTENAFFGYRAGALNSTANSNSFFGFRAGAVNTTGANNAFFGTEAGNANVSGAGNSFFGYRAGFQNVGGGNSFFGLFSGSSNVAGIQNSFFGSNAGLSNVGGVSNSFFGFFAGSSNTSSSNSFFGANSGRANGSGQENSFFGADSGRNNSTGSFNTFVGGDAGLSNTTASGNTFVGRFAGRANTTADGNSYFGFQAGQAATGNDNSFFGSNAGFGNTTGFFNSFFGSQAGDSNMAGNGNSFFGYGAGAGTTSGNRNTFIGQEAGSDNTTGNNNTTIGWSAQVGAGYLSFATALGSGAVVNTSDTIQLGRSTDQVRVSGRLNVADDLTVTGTITFASLGSAGSTDLCRNGSSQISTCSSSLRYKTGVQPFLSGLDVVRRLRPISFSWNDDGLRDVGFGAEEVEKVEPLLVTRNAKGEIEGVKYKQITTVLINAVREQQQIIEQQQRQIDALKRLVCLSHPQAEVCK